MSNVKDTQDTFLHCSMTSHLNIEGYLMNFDIEVIYPLKSEVSMDFCVSCNLGGMPFSPITTIKKT